MFRCSLSLEEMLNERGISYYSDREIDVEIISRHLLAKQCWITPNFLSSIILKLEINNYKKNKKGWVCVSKNKKLGRIVLFVLFTQGKQTLSDDELNKFVEMIKLLENKRLIRPKISLAQWLCDYYQRNARYFNGRRLSCEKLLTFMENTKLNSIHNQAYLQQIAIETNKLVSDPSDSGLNETLTLLSDEEKKSLKTNFSDIQDTAVLDALSNRLRLSEKKSRNNQLQHLITALDKLRTAQNGALAWRSLNCFLSCSEKTWRCDDFSQLIELFDRGRNDAFPLVLFTAILEKISTSVSMSPLTKVKLKEIATSDLSLVLQKQLIDLIEVSADDQKRVDDLLTIIQNLPVDQRNLYLEQYQCLQKTMPEDYFRSFAL